MGKLRFIAMTTDEAGADLIESDLKELGSAARNLANHAMVLVAGGRVGFGTTFFKALASIAAIYLLILDRTNWKTNMLTALLIPYIFLSLPNSVFNFLSGEFGKWVAVIAIVLRLFFPRRFPGWLELPAALILLLVVAPSLFADTIRDNLVGIFACLFIGAYLLQEHIRASGGFRNSFTEKHGISNTIGIILLLVYPIWAIVVSF